MNQGAQQSWILNKGLPLPGSNHGPHDGTGDSYSGDQDLVVRRIHSAWPRADRGSRDEGL